MISTIFAWLKLIPQLYSQLMVLIGMIEKAEHDAKYKKISDATQQAADPAGTEEQHHEATHNLEDQINRHS